MAFQRDRSTLSGNTSHGVTTRALAAVGAGALLLHAVRFGIKVFGPPRPYRVQKNAHLAPDAPDFPDRLASLANTPLCRGAEISVLQNGRKFYPAELAAIDGATENINLQAYEFDEGNLTREFVGRLAACAHRGVEVRVLIDAIGSHKTSKAYFEPLLAAGGRFAWYHPINWKDWAYFDHRSHRKLLTVDGKVGFIGGADYADHWIESVNGQPPWRDTVFRTEGGVVRSLNAVFAQNWGESTGEILFDAAQFPADHAAGEKICTVTASMPGYGTSQARVLFQVLIDSARSSIQITTPYFLPDRSARHALERAQRRGVKVEVLTAGSHTDHPSVRRLSEVSASRMLKAGVRFYEYQPAMIHAKLMTIDGAWTVAGSTNFDHRSFALNDEVNIAIFDREITGSIEEQFQEDLKRSAPITLATLRNESLGGRLIADASWIFRRQE